MLQWKIKICGITNPVDAVAASVFGADAIGLNFYPRSLRCITPDEAAAIVAQIPATMSRIGVFVNAPVQEINETVERLQLHAVQLHGDETPEYAEAIQCPILRAIRVMNGQFESATAEIERWLAVGVDALLLDAGGGSGSEYGGTGKPLHWESVSKMEIGVPFVLAGGLNCDNVAQAIRTARPAAVDVSSGIEKFPGKKDHARMKQFIETAMQVFATL